MHTESISGSRDSRAREPAGDSELAGLLSKGLDGLDLAEIMIQDSKTQRRIGRVLKRMETARKRLLVMQAVRRMIQAAEKGFSSGLWGFSWGVLSNAFGQYAQAVNSLFSGVDPFRFEASLLNGEAERLRLGSQEAGEAAGRATDMIQGAREIERRMLGHLDSMSNADHQCRMGLLGKIG